LVEPIAALGQPTGTVTVIDSFNQEFCTITLPATSCTFAPTIQSTATVVAHYSGDASYASVTSNSLPLRVGPVDSSVRVSVTPNPTVVGQVAPGQNFTDNHSDAAISDLSTPGNQALGLDGPTINTNTLLTNVVKRDGLEIEPDHLEWGGVAAFKKAYEVFLERGFQARLLAAAYRNQLQWTELVGGDIVLSPPFSWQEKFQASGHDPVSRIDEPVDPAVVDALRTIPDFVRAYEVDGMSHAEFDDFGATRTTLRQFPGSYIGCLFNMNARTRFDLGIERVLLDEPLAIKF